MTDPHDGPRLESWQRFTLLDFLLLQAALVLGFSFSWSLGPVRGGWAERLVTAVAFGVVFAGPIVLAVQWLARHRRALPSAGEQLWIASFFLWTVGFFLIVLMYVADRQALHSQWAEYASGVLEMSTCPLILTQTACSLWAFVLLVRTGSNNQRRVPCAWTDRSGCAASLIFGLWLWHWPVVGFLGLA